MNKKGFTLVELLAVIAILAILVIIALPNVLSMFNDSKKNSFMTEVREVFSTAQKQFMADAVTGAANGLTYSNNLTTACDPATGKLEMQGRAVDGGSLSYSITLNSDGTVASMNVSDGTFSYSGTPTDASEIISDSIKTGDTYTAATCTAN